MIDFDLSFEEAVNILQNKIGWVQGEEFENNEYLVFDEIKNMFVKNVRF